MEIYTVYKLISPNKKVYIGISKKIERRFKEYEKLRCKNQILLYNSLKKYGWDNFTKEILYKNLSKEEAKQKEKEFILIYKQLNNSLNITFGGEGAFGLLGELNPLSEKIVQLDKDLNYIKTWSSSNEISRFYNYSQGSISRAINSGYRTAFGFFWVKEEKYNRKELPKSKENKSKKSVQMYDLEGNFIKEFKSIKEAIKYTGLNKTTIHRNLNKQVKSRFYDFRYKN